MKYVNITYIKIDSVKDILNYKEEILEVARQFDKARVKYFEESSIIYIRPHSVFHLCVLFLEKMKSREVPYFLPKQFTYKQQTK